MVSELGECIPCFPDKRGRFGATGSDLGNGMRNFVKEKKILISPEPVRHLNMCVLSQNPTYIQYIFKYKMHTYTHIPIYIYTHMHTYTHIHTYIHMHTHIHTHIHGGMHTYTHIPIYLSTHTYIHEYIQACMLSLSHTHTHTHTYTHTHTHEEDEG